MHVYSMHFRKHAMAPVKLNQLEKEDQLLKKHGELNQLETKLLNRIDDLSQMQQSVDQAEQDVRVTRKKNKYFDYQNDKKD